MIQPVGMMLVVGAAVVVLAVGAVGAVFYERRRRSRPYSYTQSSPRSSRAPEPRNLTCPICGMRIVNRPHEIECGHHFHRLCYEDKVRYLREQGDTVWACPLCSHRIDLAPSRPSGSSSSDNSSASNVRKRNVETRGSDCCSYCINNTTFGNRTKLNCGHFAHYECERKYCTTQQCIHCAAKSQNSEDSNCCGCQTPIGASDCNIRERSDCGHRGHADCLSLGFMRCAVCQADPENSNSDDEARLY